MRSLKVAAQLSTRHGPIPLYISKGLAGTSKRRHKSTDGDIVLNPVIWTARDVHPFGHRRLVVSVNRDSVNESANIREL